MADIPPKIQITELRPATAQDHALKRKNWLIWIVIGISAALVVLFLVLFLKAQSSLKNAQKELKSAQQDPAAQAKLISDDLVSKVGKLMILPKDEDPTIATVSDLSKLQGQPFFEKAEVGDKVLIYQKAKTAILYRPSTNLIIALAPLNSSSEPGTPTNAQPSAASPAQ